MNAGEWGAVIGGTVVVFAVVYFVLLIRGAENERVISGAITAMVAARNSKIPAPQRTLLHAVAGVLRAQERAAAKIEIAIYKSALPGRQLPELDELVKELLALPEPQLLAAEFLADNGGGPWADGAPDPFAAQLVIDGTAVAYADLADQDGTSQNGVTHNGVTLRELLLVAMDGRIEGVARAGFERCGPAWLAHVPRLSDGSPLAMSRVASALDQATRRQLRLATLLHGQAEAILRLRGQRDEAERKTWRFRIHRLLAYPRLLLRRSQFEPDDLAVLEVALDAVGEAVDTAAEQLAGDPTRAIYLLADLQAPVPGGLPGRIYNQSALSQVRPLAAAGVWHRLAVCRWAAASREAIASGLPWPPAPAAAPVLPAVDGPLLEKEVGW